MRTSYEIFGKEVYHPALKVLAVVLTVLFWLILLPLMVPFHFILRAMGRYGCFYKSYGRWNIKLCKESFERRE